MLKYRLVTGPILIVLLLAIVVLDERLGRRGVLLYSVAMVVSALGAVELSKIIEAVGIRSRAWLSALAATAGLSLCFWIPPDTDAGVAIAIVVTGVVAVFALALLTFCWGRNTNGVLASSASVLLTMVYLGFMLGFLVMLRSEHSAWWIVGVIFTTKACDTGAYFTGRAIGRHKLIPWLSPGKTWEGLVGGVAASTLVGLGLAAASRAWLEPPDHVPALLGLACGGVFGVVGQLGDLTMSLLKRDAGVKDSSTILPGLGGVLDVLDSPLLVAPVAYWMLTLGLAG